MNIFQIIATLFALFMMYVVNIHAKKKTLSAVESSFWYTIWAFFIVITVFPFLLTDVAGVLRFARVFDFLVVTTFMIMTFLIVTSYFAQKENSKKLENLVRQIAIERYEKKH